MKKLLRNCGREALRALGPSEYLRYLFTLAVSLPRVLCSGDLKPVDQRMGSIPLRIHFQGRRFLFDVARSDELVQDGTYSFGAVRELYIRNCYIRHGLEARLRDARTIVDLGANRGAFSVMAAAGAAKVVCVEAQSQLIKVIEHNMRCNCFENYAIENAFVGEGGLFEGVGARRTSIEAIREKHDLRSIDLMKIDIEGSEFALLRGAGWLDCVGAVCMEVHPEAGQVREVVGELQAHGFTCVTAGNDFSPVADPQKAGFIYAHKPL